jgi:hypothetical protein
MARERDGYNYGYNILHTHSSTWYIVAAANELLAVGRVERRRGHQNLIQMRLSVDVLRRYTSFTIWVVLASHLFLLSFSFLFCSIQKPCPLPSIFLRYEFFFFIPLNLLRIYSTDTSAPEIYREFTKEKFQKKK